MSHQIDKKENENLISTKGTIKFLNIEGGFYGIIGEDGTRYKPCKLIQEFQKDGLRVYFEAKKIRALVSIHMWGINVKIISIKKL